MYFTPLKVPILRDIYSYQEYPGRQCRNIYLYFGGIELLFTGGWAKRFGRKRVVIFWGMLW